MKNTEEIKMLLIVCLLSVLTVCMLVLHKNEINKTLNPASFTETVNIHTE